MLDVGCGRFMRPFLPEAVLHDLGVEVVRGAGG